jgi:hypothetical protein
MNKSLWLVIVSLALLASAQAMNYPEPFVGTDKADVLIVYPKIAATSTLIAAVDISSNLQYYLARNSPYNGSTCSVPGSASGCVPTNNSGYYTVTVSDNEIFLFGGHNLISIGLNCENKVSNSILGLNENCSNFEEKINFTEGYIIKLFQSPYNSSKTAMIIIATDDNLLKNATKFITKNNFSTDIGSEIKEVKTLFEPLIVKISFFQRIVNWFKRIF